MEWPSPISWAVVCKPQGAASTCSQVVICCGKLQLAGPQTQTGAKLYEMCPDSCRTTAAPVVAAAANNFTQAACKASMQLQQHLSARTATLAGEKVVQRSAACGASAVAELSLNMAMGHLVLRYLVMHNEHIFLKRCSCRAC